MEAPGNMLPSDRTAVYPYIEGTVQSIRPGLKSGSEVTKDQELFEMHSLSLGDEIRKLKSEMDGLEAQMAPPFFKAAEAMDAKLSEQLAAAHAARHKHHQLGLQLQSLRLRTKADLTRPGFFKITAPKKGIILSDDFRDNLVGRPVKPNELLLSIGYTDKNNPRRSEWELKLKIPQKHVGQVMRAYDRLPAGAELDVDVLVKADSAAGSFRAKLKKDRIAPQANPQRDAADDAEPVVLAWARIEARYVLTEKVLNDLRGAGLSDDLINRLNTLKDRRFDSRDLFLRDLGRLLKADESKHETRIVEYACRDDIPLDMQILPSLLLTNSEVSTRIRCGNAAMGYSLFYGVWEFIYDKVIFPLKP
jgi:hypothetical protein